MAQTDVRHQTQQETDGWFKRYRELIMANRFSYLLLVPTFVFVVLLLWFPFTQGIWMSLHEWPLIGQPEWVGVGNYAYLFSWDVFYTSLKATIIFASTTIIQLAIAIIAALIVSNLQRFENVVSGAFLIPYTMPPVVTGTLWLFLLNPNFGPVFQYLVEWGILKHPIPWSTLGNWSMAIVTLVAAWTFWPFMFLIILATLENIPADHYEAARVYGASRIQQFLRITLPQLKSAILVAVSIRFVWNMSKVSQILQLTGGGPGFDTSVLAVLLYRFAYRRGAMGLSYSVGIILLLFVLMFIVLFIWEFEQSEGGISG